MRPEALSSVRAHGTASSKQRAATGIPCACPLERRFKGNGPPCAVSSQADAFRIDEAFQSILIALHSCLLATPCDRLC